MAKVKKPKKIKNTLAAPQPSMYQEKKSARITEADNGFTVSTYGPHGEQLRVAPSIGAALRHTRELMAGKKK